MPVYLVDSATVGQRSSEVSASLVFKPRPRFRQKPPTFRDVGLELIVKIFHFYGLLVEVPLDRSPKTPRRIPVVIYLNLVCYVLLCIIGLGFIVVVVSSSDDESSIGVIILTIGFLSYQVRTLFNYLHAVLLLERYSRFLFHLLHSLERLLSESAIRVERIALWVRIVAGATIAHVACSVVINIVNFDQFFADTPQWTGNPTADLLLLRCLEIVIVVPITVGSSFFVFYQYFVLLICKLLLVGFDHFLPTDDRPETVFGPDFFERQTYRKDSVTVPKDITLAERQEEHQNISKLVQEADDILSTFLITTIIEELTIIIMYCSGITFELTGAAMVATVFGNSVKVALYLLKTIYASNVNEKVISSLTVPRAHNLCPHISYNSGEHANYLIYLKQQSMKNMSLTYGGFFPVRQTFIFTVASTAITYMLVIKDMKSKNKDY